MFFPEGPAFIFRFGQKSLYVGKGIPGRRFYAFGVADEIIVVAGHTHFAAAALCSGATLIRVRIGNTITHHAYDMDPVARDLALLDQGDNRPGVTALRDDSHLLPPAENRGSRLARKIGGKVMDTGRAPDEATCLLRGARHERSYFTPGVLTVTNNQFDIARRKKAFRLLSQGGFALVSHLALSP
jgi:hypothetical protein